ncbi:serine/threonine protein phosphatase T, putative [Entamoeba invadens IP1]|uniref:Serine/threonine-protein phosphatase n=1 Tax=Entamoeba invadens IP1 TaxID=370355 RepID=A0A0A1U4K9_ENTIV|nr:serine/threonine protein phosphatase T, putative [Entamoeba invadens IP1]ELP87813.1 serine/threonine protein phosphatase T, putative [Entamoeba invadens IP1]|eukprot:XP_004254584.1 serine/threonine protein phosphatase T, putative [Entamoeba invadens IP1]
MSYRDLGNKAFASQNYVEAVKHYTSAIEVDPMNPTNFSNRSLCYLKLENNASALADSQIVIDLDPTNPKGWYRHALSSIALHDIETALIDLKKAMTLSSDPQICSLYNSITTPLPSSSKKTTKSPHKLNPQKDFILTTKITYDVFYQNCLITQIFPKSLLLAILSQAHTLLLNRPPITQISSHTLRIIGDTHGQFAVISKCADDLKSNPNLTLLFNGDIVDRGSRGVECLFGVLSLFLEHPTRVYINRGNHEEKDMNMAFGFYVECLKKLDEEVYEKIEELYRDFPLAHVLRDSVFIVHGGLPETSFSIKTTSLKKMERYDSDDIENQFLWADPQIKNGTSRSPRGTGYTFGPDILTRFLIDNNLKYLVRSHEVKPFGFEWDTTGKMLTIFSAPKYNGLTNFGAYADVWFDAEESQEVPHFTVTQFRDYDELDRGDVTSVF